MSADLPAILGGTPVFPAGPPAWPPADPAIHAALQAAADAGAWAHYDGPFTQQLREQLARWSGCGHVELCCSGTAACELALRALQIGPGDEVILAAYDYPASFRTVLMLQATPVLVDTSPATLAPTAAHIEAAITGHTKAIVVSHLHGAVADMPAIMDLAARHQLTVIEDACQATGGTLAGKRLGSFGTLGILSFGGSKLLAAGRGGAILGNDDQLFQRMKLYATRGNSAYPLSELQAAVLLPQLQSLDARNTHRADRVSELHTALAGSDGIDLVATPADASPAYYKFGLLLNSAIAGVSRDRFVEAARADGIALDRGLYALHSTHSKRRFRAAGPLTGADHIDAQLMQLHHPILLGSTDDIRQLADAIHNLLTHAHQLA